MKIINTSARLICLNTKGGRIDVLPAVVTEDERLSSLKGKNKIFDYYLEDGIFKEVKGNEDSVKKSPKDILIDEAEALGIDTTDMTKADLTEAIAEVKGNED